MEGSAFTTYEEAARQLDIWTGLLNSRDLDGVGLIILCDDAAFTARNISNLVWVAFTKSNPSHDLYGVDSSIEYKHWGCSGPVIIDARKKPHHAPDLIMDPAVEKRVDAMGAPGQPLHGII